MKHWTDNLLENYPRTAVIIDWSMVAGICLLVLAVAMSFMLLNDWHWLSIMGFGGPAITLISLIIGYTLGSR